LHYASFIANNDNSAFGPGEHDVHPVSVVEKANIAVVV